MPTLEQFNEVNNRLLAYFRQRLGFPKVGRDDEFNAKMKEILRDKTQAFRVQFKQDDPVRYNQVKTLMGQLDMLNRELPGITPPTHFTKPHPKPSAPQPPPPPQQMPVTVQPAKLDTERETLLGRAAMMDFLDKNKVQTGGKADAKEETVKIKSYMLQSAFRGYFQNIEFSREDPTNNLILFLDALLPEVRTELEKALKEKKGGIKFFLSLTLKYAKPGDHDREQHPFVITCPAKTVFNVYDVDNALPHCIDFIKLRNGNMVRLQSGLVIDTIYFANLQTARHNPLSHKKPGRGYKELPKFLKNKHCIINVETPEADIECFRYAFLASIRNLPRKMHANRAYNYNDPALIEQYHLDTIQYPVALEDIPDLEERLGTRINVFSFSGEGHNRYPLYVSDKYDLPRELDLLYWDEHYAWLKNYTAFVCDKSTRHKLYHCKRCLSHFTNERTCEAHKKNCRNQRSEEHTSELQSH